MKGTLYGIGVGPGDPRLMTYLVVDTIKRCPVIAVPADGKGKAVAYKIASGIVEDLDAKECLNLSTPMTKDKAILDAAYQTAADTIIEQLEQGKDVACLTLGDPTIYSTYIYIHRLVKAKGYETEIVNGIPSFCAAAAISKIPLTAWDEDLVIAPVRKNNAADLEKLLTEHENVVLMKPSTDSEALVSAIQASGRENSFVLVEKAGTKEQRLIREYQTLKEEPVPYLSLMILKSQKQ